MPFLDRTRAPLPAVRLAAALAALGCSLGGAWGCSLVVESQGRQCERDADCSGFGDAVCDVEGGVCLPRENPAATTTTATTSATSSTGSTGEGGSTGAGCVGPDGCFACAPDAQVEYLNACTDAACIPYDNGQLAGLLEEDGSVPPVP